MSATTLIFIVLLLIGIWAIWAFWCIINMGKKKSEPKVNSPTLRAKKDERFSQNSEFCPHCLTKDYFYRGGGSWSPDRCPFHPMSDDFILWKQMTLSQRNKAAKRFQRMWKEMHGTEYVFTKYEDNNDRQY